MTTSKKRVIPHNGEETAPFSSRRSSSPLSTKKALNYPTPMDRSTLVSPKALNDEKKRAAKKPKYNNTRIKVDTIWFHSKDEAAHYLALSYQQGQGLIRDLELQPKFPIVMNGVQVASYFADFRYWHILGNERIVVDVKSPATRVDKTYRLKKKLVEAQYGITITEYPPTLMTAKKRKKKSPTTTTRNSSRK